MESHFGPYELREKLGEGGMGTVYRAFHTGLDREVALKIIRPTEREDPEAVRRFHHEMVLLARLNHPGIVKIYDGGRIDDVEYIAMELVEGRPLFEIIVEGAPFQWETALGMLGRVVDGLKHLHASGSLHRDINPANILVEPGGEVKLCDLGLAWSNNVSAVTKAGTVVGTVEYMAPEILRGERPSVRSDIWSAGIVLYEMLTAHSPFELEDRTLPEIVNEIINSPITPPDQIVKTIPPEISRFNMQLLTRTVAARPVSAEAVEIRVMELLEQEKPCQITKELAAVTEEALALYPQPPPAVAPRPPEPAAGIPQGATISAGGKARPRRVPTQQDAGDPMRTTGGSGGPARSHPASPPLAVKRFWVALAATAILTTLAILSWVKLGSPFVDRSGSTVPAGTEPQEEIAALKRIQDWSSGFSIQLKRWSRENTLSKVLLVVSSLNWSHSAQLALEPGCRLATINGMKMQASRGRITEIDYRWLHDGVNWLQIDSPTDRDVLGTFFIPAMPCPMVISSRSTPPPEIEYLDMIQYHLITPERDGIAMARTEMSKRWSPDSPIRAAAEAWLNILYDMTIISLEEFDNGARQLYPSPNEGLRSDESHKIVGEFIETQQRIIDADPGRADAWYALGWILGPAGYGDCAVGALARSIANWPQNYWAWLEIAKRDLELRDYAQRQHQTRDQERYWQLADTEFRLALRFLQLRKNDRLNLYQKVIRDSLDRLGPAPTTGSSPGR